jgi:hypothetical protein
MHSFASRRYLINPEGGNEVRFGKAKPNGELLEISFPINVLSEISRPDIFSQTIGSVGPGAQNSRAQAADINKTATKCSNGAQMAPKPTTKKLSFPSGQEGVKALGCCKNQDFCGLGPFSWISIFGTKFISKNHPLGLLGMPLGLLSQPSPRHTPNCTPTTPPYPLARPPTPLIVLSFIRAGGVFWVFVGPRLVLK